MKDQKIPYSKVWYNKRCEATNWPADDMCDPPTPDNEAINALITGLLGENWYIVMPESGAQINTAAVYHILRNYRDPQDVSKWPKLGLGLFIFCMGILIGIIIGSL